MNVKPFGLVAILLFCVGDITPATAHEFEATASTTVHIKGGVQTFTFTAGKATCRSVKSVPGRNSIKAGKAESILVSQQYTTCEAFGTVATLLRFEAYLLDANRTWDLLQGQPFVSDTASKCSVLITSGLSTLKGVTYTNSGNNLKVSIQALNEIHYIPSGGVCGTAKHEESNGSYEGEYLIEPESGALSWS